jgi:hypothetical protein
MGKWRMVSGKSQTFYDVGIISDGSLHNPRGYPEDQVREAVAAAEARLHKQRSDSAKKAVVTKRRYQEKRIAAYAQRWLSGQGIASQDKCAICHRKLDDPASIQRGVGSECWQAIQAIIDANTAPVSNFQGGETHGR